MEEENSTETKAELFKKHWEVKILRDKLRGPIINFYRQLFSIEYPIVSGQIQISNSLKNAYEAQESIDYSLDPDNNLLLHSSSPLIEVVRYHKSSDLKLPGTLQLFPGDSIFMGEAKVLLVAVSHHSFTGNSPSQMKEKENGEEFMREPANVQMETEANPKEAEKGMDCPISFPKMLPSGFIPDLKGNCFNSVSGSVQRDPSHFQFNSNSSNNLAGNQLNQPPLTLQKRKSGRVCRICLGKSEDDEFLMEKGLRSKHFLVNRVCQCADYHDECFEMYLKNRIKIEMPVGENIFLVPLIPVNCEVCKVPLDYRDVLAKMVQRKMGGTEESSSTDSNEGGIHSIVIRKISWHSVDQECCLIFKGRSQVKIGRNGKECLLQFSDKTVDQTHCVLTLDPPSQEERIKGNGNPAVYVEDLNSVFGTHVIHSGEKGAVKVSKNAQAFLNRERNKVVLFLKKEKPF